jgi:HEAT repeat protein
MWEMVLRLFEANGCLGMYAWIEAMNSYFHAKRWDDGVELLGALKASRLAAHPSAREVIQEVASTLISRPVHCTLDGLAFLTRTLNEPSPGQQREAVLAMAQLRAVAVLDAALAHESASIRMVAAGGLRNCNEAALPAFRSAIGHFHWFVRWQAVEHLALYGDPADDALLCVAIGDADADIVVAAAGSLSQRGHQPVRSALRALLPTDVRDSNGRRIEDSIRAALLRFDSKMPRQKEPK